MVDAFYDKRLALSTFSRGAAPSGFKVYEGATPKWLVFRAGFRVD
jgi:hypothetical protein